VACRIKSEEWRPPRGSSCRYAGFRVCIDWERDKVYEDLIDPRRQDVDFFVHGPRVNVNTDEFEDVGMAELSPYNGFTESILTTYIVG
jgi:hypothetical protein